MKKLVFFLLISMVISVHIYGQSQTPVYLSQSIAGGNSRGFYKYLPVDYESSTKNYPLIIWVHGAGQIGQGNAANLPKVLEWGVPKIINEGGFPDHFIVNDTSFSFIILSPQFADWPNGGNIGAIINYAQNNFRVDPSRIYLMGISAGGGGVWDYASASVANSNNVAAIIPFCGTQNPTQTQAGRIASSNLPVWAFHNTNDGTVPVAYSRNWINYINNYNPRPNPLAKLTEFPVVSNNAVIAHECWSLATLPSYKPEGINIYEWLLRYRKRTATLNSLPIASAGPDQGVVLPATLTLDGSASTDPDGIIVKYKWQKISGPAYHTFSDSTTSNPVVSNLKEGVYNFQLTVTDNFGATSSDFVVVNVYPALPPGALQRVLIDVGPNPNYGGTLTASPSLNGNYWNNMIDARPGVQITNALTTTNKLSGIAIEVINRVDGTYSPNSLGVGGGNITGVVNDYPASSTTDHALIHISATNGRWRVKGLKPGNVYTIKFWGSRSNTTALRTAEIKRADDNVWQSYTATANANYNNAAVFNVSGKTEMDFDIRVKAGSDFSCINIIDISFNEIVIAPPVNLPPIARAGNDTTLQLPLDSLILNGCTSTDPEDGVLQYKWRKISGPASYLLVADNFCSVNLRNLVTGVYAFELAVTDTAGLIGKDTLSITIKALQPTNWPPQVTPICNTPFKIVIIGSSTTYGSGASPIDSSWVNKLRLYVQQQNLLATVINLGSPGYTSYHLSPTGTVVPVNRPFPVDTTHNITKALSLKPDAIIMNLPSNDIALGIPVSEIQFNFNRIVAYADSLQVPIWISTTQPRNGLSPAERQMQIELKNWILTRFSSKAIDFWTTVANTDGTINELYSAGDGVHLNNNGHHLLFVRTVAENIWDTICLRKNISPVSNAGNDSSITLPANMARLNGILSYDPDGSIASYKWRCVTGTNYQLSDSNSLSTDVSFVNPGIYIFTLTVTDNYGKTAIDSVKITVLPDSNIKPVANAGPNIFIQMPVNNVTLNGSESVDPDGIIVSYRWRMINPTSGFIILDSLASITQVNFTSDGVFIFELKVTDNKGVSSNDTVIVTVNPVPNNKPVAMAGADQTIQLPVSAVTLNGAASFDTDGTIVSYKWRCINVSQGYNIANTNATQTLVSFSQAGIYNFELNVLDNKGGLGLDTVTITVNPDPNVPPVANAGPDVNIQLPLNKIYLDGRNSTDPDGTTLSFNWQLISGPAGSGFNTTTKDTCTLTVSSAGTYICRLTVTDAGGLTAVDEMTIVVLSPINVGKTMNVNIYGGTNPYNNPQWNNWNMNASTSSAKFTYDDASSSNISAVITASAQIADNGNNYAASATICPPAVLRYNSYNTSIRTITFSGMDKTKLYSFEFYGSRANTGNSSIFKIGNYSDTIETSNNVNDYAKFFDIKPDNSGKITVNMSRIGTYTYLAGFRIKEDVTAVASPLTFARNNLESDNLQAEEIITPTLIPGEMLIWPNPAQESIQFRLPDFLTGNYKIIISDINNRKLLEKSGEKKIELMNVNMNVAGLKRGTYILTLVHKDYKVKRLFIKL